MVTTKSGGASSVGNAPEGANGAGNYEPAEDGARQVIRASLASSSGRERLIAETPNADEQAAITLLGLVPAELAAEALAASIASAQS